MSLLRLYADHNATTPLSAFVKKALTEGLDDVLLANASSVHAHGRHTRQIIEKVRKTIADILNTSSKNIVFTSGASEAASWILKGFSGPVCVANDAHDCLKNPRKDAHIISMDAHGLLDMHHLDKTLDNLDKPALVAVMAANNETGIIQTHLHSIVQRVHEKGGLVLCDAVQVFGKIPLPQALFSCDFIIGSGHKIAAPSGIGFAKIPSRVPLEKLIHGGGQERSFRGGSENILGIIGLGAALNTLSPFPNTSLETVRNYFEEKLQILAPDIKIIGQKHIRLPNTSCVVMPHVKGEIQVMHFDLNHISVSAGSACSSGKVSASPVLKAMNLSDMEASCAARFSFSQEWNSDHMDRLISVWQDLYVKKCNRAPPSSKSPYALTY